MESEAVPAIEPLASAQSWATTLKAISREPLEFCLEFPTIAARHEAWWRQGCLDRPLLMAWANTRPSRPIDRRLDLLAQPDAWLDAKLQDMMQTLRVGDALPHVRVDFGPVMLGALLGAEVGFGADTTWTHAFIDDAWSNAPRWEIREDNPWWKLLQELTRRTAEAARGRFLVCTPDLGGSGDVLLNLRGATGLCMDAVTQPERIRDAVDALYPVWRKAFEMLHRVAVEDGGAGLIHWLGLWSNRPYMIPACDFNFMLGPAQFETLLLPDIARQAATVGRAVFHLDGPGAAVHIDALLQVQALQAIQFTPGAGTPSVLPWLDMCRRIQAAGKSVILICPACEVLEVCKALKPEGLALLVDTALSVDEAEALYRAVCRYYGCVTRD